ncbi:hypothetical protein AJ78_05188 [Emergomyces pasteurianus Ep9510]|uniref:Uncharacterized protein n=1 Tax=Emergomyces pasteurianus Ep9510 TaxID=1447872 RepID=A0A1J9QGY0_9EURO|nr:hypothetical protein AJ78_05188 [Emergomyces pasteurianus Ep9510]
MGRNPKKPGNRSETPPVPAKLNYLKPNHSSRTTMTGETANFDNVSLGRCPALDSHLQVPYVMIRIMQSVQVEFPL